MERGEQESERGESGGPWAPQTPGNGAEMFGKGFIYPITPLPGLGRKGHVESFPPFFPHRYGDRTGTSVWFSQQISPSSPDPRLTRVPKHGGGCVWGRLWAICLGFAHVLGSVPRFWPFLPVCPGQGGVGSFSRRRSCLAEFVEFSSGGFCFPSLFLV